MPGDLNCHLLNAKKSFPLRFSIRHRQVPQETEVLQYLCSDQAAGKEIESVYNGWTINKETQIKIKSG